jgi:hypothetical protein
VRRRAPTACATTANARRDGSTAGSQTSSLDMVGWKSTYACKQYTVKKVIDFPVPSRYVTNQTLPSGE